MTSTALLLLAAQTSSESPTAAFDRAIAAHDALKSGSATIQVVQSAKGANARLTSVVQFIRPNRLKLRTTAPASGNVAAADHTYTLVGSKLYGVDHGANEYIVRNVLEVGTLANRLHSATGQVPQPVSLLLDPTEMRTFLSRMKTVRGWTMTQAAGVRVLKASLPTFGSYVVRFSSTNNRLLGAKIQTPASTIDWTYKYSTAPKSIGFTAPRGAVKVDVFYLRQKAPAFADATAKNLYNAGVAAYRRLKTISYSVEDSSGKWTVSHNRSAVNQQGPGGTFIWTSGTLTVIRGSQKSTFKCIYRDIEHELSKAKVPVEPTLRILLGGLNPMEYLLTGLKVRSQGSVSINGVTFHILEGSKPGYRITLQQRGDSRLLANTISEQLDKSGRSLNRAERRFTYR